MPGESQSDDLPSLSKDEKHISRQLSAHVEVIAGWIGERNIGQEYHQLTKAAEYIETSFQALGYTVMSQKFVVEGKSVRNIEAIKTGKQLVDEIVIVGAHYDSAWNTPAANDNGSGVAALLELARLMKQTPSSRTIRFVAFVN